LSNRPFLTARWESLVLLNYECPQELLTPLLPTGTSLDPLDGVPLVSLVGFMFRDTRVHGIGLPFHRTFEEVNLRFYVRRRAEDGEVRRAVVFIRELVPRWIIAAVARRVYNEPYRAVRMEHAILLDPAIGGSAEYSWWHRGNRFTMWAAAAGAAADSAPASEAEFITEHYWGYTRQHDGSTLEYRVDHPRWLVWNVSDAGFSGPSESLYGAGFAEILRGKPRSAFLAVGSEVAVYPGRKLDGI